MFKCKSSGTGGVTKGTYRTLWNYLFNTPTTPQVADGLGYFWGNAHTYHHSSLEPTLLVASYCMTITPVGVTKTMELLMYTYQQTVTVSEHNVNAGVLASLSSEDVMHPELAYLVPEIGPIWDEYESVNVREMQL